MPFLSVIVPIYNADKYLEECLDSIMNQTYGDYEVILVNDGSTDKSPQICDMYAKRYRNVRIVNKENGGQISARRAGLALARGEYIGLVDSDDTVAPDMFEKMCGEAWRTGADIVICDMWSWSGDRLTPIEQAVKSGGVYTDRRLRDEIYPHMLYAGKFYSFGILPSQVNKIVRTPIIRKNMENLDDNIRIGEDAACTYFCMLDAKSISYLKGEFLYKYRVNLSSMCFSWKEEKITSASVLLDFFYRRLKEYDMPCMNEQFWYYFVCIYTNVYFEYGVSAYAERKRIRHKNIVHIKDKIQIEGRMRQEFVYLMRDNLLRLPLDRKILVKATICGQRASVLPALFILKLRCLLMFAYRRCKG